MKEYGIPKNYKIQPDKIPEPTEPEVVKKANPISDELRRSQRFSTFYRVKEVWTDNITVKPQKMAVKSGSTYYLVSDDGNEVHKDQDKSFHNVSLVFRNFKGKEVYVANRGSRIWLVDGQGNKLHPRKYGEFEYLGDGEFKTGMEQPRGNGMISFRID